MQTQYNSRGGVRCFAQRRHDNPNGAFFDLFHPGGDELATVIGNVDSGGIPGTILTTGLQVSLRCMVRQGVDLRNAVTEVNRILWELTPDAVHGTLLSARVNPSARSLRYINAGHHTAFVIHSGRGVEYLEPNAAPLGLSRTSSYREHKIRFEPGDFFITATDDIECRDLGCIVTAAQTGEASTRTAARIVIVVSYRDPDEGPARCAIRIPAAPVLSVAA
jgi:serine phosphatase RsbU (regulator of sigma subunit)